MTEWGSGVLKEVDPQVHGQLTSDIGQRHFRRERKFSSINVAGIHRYS